MKKSINLQKKQSIKKEKVEVEDKTLRLKRMISSDVKRFVNILGVNQYDVKVYYAESSDDKEYEMFQGSIVGATTSVDTRYLTADLRVYPYLADQWKKGIMSDDNVHDMIAHEIAHIATSEIRRLAVAPFKGEDEVRNAWESLTTIIGRLMNRIDEFSADNR